MLSLRDRRTDLPAPPPGGYTLVEVLTTLVVLGILAMLVAPSLGGMTARVKRRAALDRVAGDIAYAKMLAVRSGRPVELRALAAQGAACPAAGGYTPMAGYSLVMIGANAERSVKRVEFAADARGVCVSTSNAGNVLRFNSRGLPSTLASRQFRATSAGRTDSLAVSQAGRVLRWY